MIKKPMAQRTRGNSAAHKIPQTVPGFLILIPYQSSMKPTAFHAKKRYKNRKVSVAMIIWRRSEEKKVWLWEKEVEVKARPAWLRAATKPTISAVMRERQNNHLPKSFSVSIRPSCLAGSIALIIPKRGLPRTIRDGQMHHAIFLRDCGRPCSGNQSFAPCEIRE